MCKRDLQFSPISGRGKESKHPRVSGTLSSYVRRESKPISQEAGCWTGPSAVRHLPRPHDSMRHFHFDDSGGFRVSTIAAPRPRFDFMSELVTASTRPELVACRSAHTQSCRIKLQAVGQVWRARMIRDLAALSEKHHILSSSPFPRLSNHKPWQDKARNSMQNNKLH